MSGRDATERPPPEGDKNGSPLRGYTATIPASPEECEDALYERAKAVHNYRANWRKMEPTQAQLKAIMDFMNTERPKYLLAEALGVSRDVLRRWIREIETGRRRLPNG